MLDRALEHLHHVRHLHGVCAGDEGRATGEQLLHRIDWTVEAALGVSLGLAAGGRGRAGLILGQAIHVVVHDHISETDVLARSVVQVVTTDGEPVAVTTEDEDVHVWAAEGNTSGKRQRTAMNEVNAVAVYEIRETRGATNAGHADDLLMRILKLFQDLIEGSENGEISAARAPCRMVGSEDFLGELISRCSGRRFDDGGRHSG